MTHYSKHFSTPLPLTTGDSEDAVTHILKITQYQLPVSGINPLSVLNILRVSPWGEIEVLRDNCIQVLKLLFALPLDDTPTSILP
jgi:hypothetical protein